MIIHSRKGTRKPGLKVEKPAAPVISAVAAEEKVVARQSKRKYRVIEKQPEKEELKGE